MIEITASVAIKDGQCDITSSYEDDKLIIEYAYLDDEGEEKIITDAYDEENISQLLDNIKNRLGKIEDVIDMTIEIPHKICVVETMLNGDIEVSYHQTIKNVVIEFDERVELSNLFDYLKKLLTKTYKICEVIE